jgi:hypothetical protein
MGFTLKQTKVEDGTVYAVPKRHRYRPGSSVYGWIRQTPRGWQPYGYDNPTEPRATPDEAIDDLIELDSEEQDTADWPKRY